MGRTPPPPPTDPPTAESVGPESDPIAAAIAGLLAKAGTGDPKAIRMLTDGTLDRLKAMSGETTGRPHPRNIVRGETRQPCPGCGHRLLIGYDTSQGWAELSLVDLTTIHDREPKITRSQIP